jgi:hypothetical protein
MVVVLVDTLGVPYLIFISFVVLNCTKLGNMEGEEKLMFEKFRFSRKEARN